MACVCSVGGLKEGLVIELANGSNAMVLDVTGDTCSCISLELYQGQFEGCIAEYTRCACHSLQVACFGVAFRHNLSAAPA